MEAIRERQFAPPSRRTAGAGQGVVVVLAGFLPILAIVALSPVVPRMVEQFASVPGARTIVPLAVTAPGLMIALFSPLMGWLADRYGRRQLLLVSTLVYGIVGIAPFYLSDLTTIFASRLALGFCEAAILTVTNTLIGDYFPHDQRRNWLMLQAAVGPVFGVTVLTFSGYLAAINWHVPFLIYAVALPIFVAMLAFIYEPEVIHADGASDLSEPFPVRHVALTGLVTLLSASLYYVYIVQIGLAFSGIGVTSPETVGMMIGVANIGVFLGGLLFKPISAKLPSSWQIAIFLSLMGTGMAGIGLARTEQAMTLAACLQQLGAGILIPALVLWAMNGLPAQHRGRGMGVWSACFFLGQFTSPLLVTGAGTVSSGIGGAFFALGIAALLGALGARIFARPIDA
jgi:MFS family permease